jgi:hypothetical protein
MRKIWNMLIPVAGFVGSLISVSNLLPLALNAIARGLGIWEGLLIAGYSSVCLLGLAVMARAIYRVDRKAGRVRNRIRWFE